MAVWGITLLAMDREDDLMDSISLTAGHCEVDQSDTTLF